MVGIHLNRLGETILMSITPQKHMLWYSLDSPWRDYSINFITPQKHTLWVFIGIAFAKRIPFIYHSTKAYIAGTHWNRIGGTIPFSLFIHYENMPI